MPHPLRHRSPRPVCRPRTAALVLAGALAVGGDVQAQTIAVSNGATLAVSNGAVFDLKGATLDFGTTGTLAEPAGGRVTGGLLTATRTLNAPAGVDVAGLGATITSAANLGVTTVTRGHTAGTAGGTPSVLRYYDLAPATNAGLGATLAYRYHEAELNGNAEADLALWRSTDAGATYALRGGTPDPAANTVTLGGIDALSRWTAAGADLLSLEVGVWLQGPYNAAAANMNAALSSALPTTDPYLGTASVAAGFFTSDPVGQQVVDWVLVRLAAGTPPALSFVAEAPALLLRDGRVVGPGGGTLALPGNGSSGPFYVVVRHRNHLAVMSPSAVDFGGGIGTWDFRTGAAYGSSAQAALGGGRFGLYAGDGNASGDVSAADRNGVWRVQNGLAGYRTGDYNLSGDVSAADRNALWRPNNGRASQVPAF